MEERSKTIMCSVLFLDIAEYSKKSVSGQISLKERFNAYLSMAIRDVPLDDRIILDTGDGAALSFLGDVEDALQVALSLRESLRTEAAHMDPPLLVRMGINLGPVRLIKDINGQPNIVGDGINVAQRIMGFADPGQILVSRSYYDAVSRLSYEYGDMFHYQGSRTDKHVREHEIYAIGYPGEFTVQQPAAGLITAKWRVLARQLGDAWRNAAQRLGEMTQGGIACYRAAEPRQRAIYGGGAAAVLLLAILAASLLHHRAGTPRVELAQAPAGPAPAASPAPPAPPPPAAGAKPSASQEKAAIAGGDKAGASHRTAPQAEKPKKSDVKTSKPSGEARSSVSTKTHESKSRNGNNNSIFGIPLPSQGKPGFVAVSCMEGSSIFVDGFSKGVVGKGPLNISLDPGKHHLTITHASKQSVYSEAIVVRTGETLHLHPAFCD